MNVIHKLQADAVYADSLIAYYERALQDIRSAALDYLSQDGPGAYHMQNIASRCEQAPMFALGQAQEARYAFTGPAMPGDGSHYTYSPGAGPGRCTHGSVTTPNGWHCPVCGADLRGEWNDTDARAAERMFQHWAETHRA